MLWLALHFPNLPLEVLQRRVSGPALPLVVLQDNRVYMRNAAAAQCDIGLGSTLATAHSIRSDLIHIQRDEVAEEARLKALADTLYRFSAYVSIQTPDCILLEIGGSLKLFGSHQQLRSEAQSLCATLGHAACGRVASTPWAAIALARSARRQLQAVELSDAGLELAGIEPRVIERFANMGITTLAPLLSLPAKQLGKRFGKDLLTYIGQLTGAIPDPRKAVTPASVFAEQLHFLQPLRDKTQLCTHPYSPMHKLTAELQQWLVSHQLGCAQLHWQFVSHDKQTCNVVVSFAKPRQNQGDFMQVSTLRLEQVELPEEVLTVSLTARQLRPWHNHSQGLFSRSQASKAATVSDVSSLIDELNARLGDGTCQSIVSMAQHAPESAWRTQPATLSATLSATHPAACAKRPLWLFDPPRPVRRCELELLHGPERIQSQWWQAGLSNAVCRDYYIAQHRLGAECWAFVDANAQWYLHGYFG